LTVNLVLPGSHGSLSLFNKSTSGPFAPGYHPGGLDCVR
jgi:hypothetical protein